MESDLDFARDADTPRTPDSEWRGIGRNSGTDNHERGAPDAIEVVPANLCLDPAGAQIIRARRECGSAVGVRRVDPITVFSEELRHSAPASGETNNGDLSCCGRRQVHHRAHRNFSVLSAMKAANTPRIQKRTTTWASSHPFTSKWWCSGARLNTRCSRAY